MSDQMIGPDNMSSKKVPDGQLSIHSFFKPEVSLGRHTPLVKDFKQRDSSTNTETIKTLDALSECWSPEREYQKVALNQLQPGPKAVNFMGRIVNISTRIGGSTEQPRAKGWHYLILKDDIATITIKLYFAVSSYSLQLGQLLALWTAFISETPINYGQHTGPRNLIANMFPDRVTSDHILVLHDSSMADIFNLPLGFHAGEYPQKLITLDSYLNNEYDDVEGVKILTIVSSISPSKINKSPISANNCETMDIMIMDNTAKSYMRLWNELIPSTSMWQPWKTVLLITNPGLRAPCTKSDSHKGGLRILRQTLIEVDPTFREADLLRIWGKDEARREAITWDFAEDEWDFENAEYGSVRILFTLAQLDSITRSDSDKTFTGFINVIIRNMEINRLHRRQKLMCGKCCGIPIFLNASTGTCATCGRLLTLLPNANLVSQLLDETGCINGGSLLWSPRAWEKLFGRPIGVIATWSAEECTFFEQRLCFFRVHLCIGWKAAHISNDDQRVGVGKLCVLGVRM